MIKIFSNLNLIKICEVVLKYGIYILAFLLPVFFLPWTADVLDFNKQASLIYLVMFSVFAYMLKSLAEGRIEMNLSRISWGVLIILGISILATIFSLDSYGSFWGWPRVTSESLLTLISLILFYFLIANSFSGKEVLKLVILLSFSVLIVLGIALLQANGVFLPFDFAKVPSFNPIGIMGAAGVFFAALLPLLMFLMIYSRGWKKVIFGLAVSFSFIYFLIINYLIVWWLVAGGCLLVIFLVSLKKEIFDLRWLGLPIFFLVIALFFIIFKISIFRISLPAEIYLRHPASFDIAFQTVKDRPLLGSGPGTFIYDFSKYRRAEFNKEAFWSARFNVASSKMINLLATTGILGVISWLLLYLFFLIALLKFFLKKEEGNVGGLSLTYGVLSGIILLIIGSFFYSFNLSLEFLFFLLLASFVVLISEKKKEYELKPSSFITLGVTFFFTLLFIFGLGIFFLEGQRYAAEVNYTGGVLALNKGEKEKGILKLEKAVSLNPKVDIYLTELAQAYLLRVNDVVNDKNLSQEDRSNIIQFLIDNAIGAARRASDVNPKNVANWSIRGFVYQNLVGVVGGAEDWAIKSYDEAIRLEPTNPYYPTQKGLVYIAQATILSKDNEEKKNQELEEARKQFEQAISLKSDYSPARFQIAVVYQLKGETSKQVAALEEAKRESPNDVGLLFQIGVSYYNLKEYEKARQNLEAAIRFAPRYANALYFLGLSYAKLGKTDKAIENFERVSQLNPDNEEVKKVLSNLREGKDPLAGIIEEVPPQLPIEEEKPPEKEKSKK